MTPSKATSVISCANDQAVWPWQAEPYRLWSLLDMIESFSIRDFGAFMTEIERCMSAMEMALVPVNTQEGYEKFHRDILRDAIPELHHALTGILNTCAYGNLPLSQPVYLQVKDLLERLNKGVFPGPQYNAIAENARVTRQAILNDLSQHLFFCIETAPGSDVPFGQSDPWGEKVADMFGDAKRDIEAAARCLALRESTATVFHLMRVLEHGLRPLAIRFNVPFATDSWHGVIKGIEIGLTDLRNKKGLTDFERSEITYYSEAATEFRNFKDAWRNHVSHGRDHYDERDALKVWRSVKAFMLDLTKKP